MADNLPARLLLRRFIRGVPLHLVRGPCLVRSATQPPPCAIVLDGMIPRNILWHPSISGPRTSNIKSLRSRTALVLNPTCNLR